MKITMISDTHGQHRALNLSKGDLLIHAGDVSRQGDPKEMGDFLDWFEQQDFTHKIFIAGNHDFYFEKESLATIEQIIPKNVIYLNDSGIEIEGIKIWGSPIQPWFFDWAFNRKRGEEIKQHWDLIPDETDILITHGPPHGILDLTSRGISAGCEDLLEKVKTTQTKIHVFGHIHEAYGGTEKNGIQYINASVLNLRYQLVNSPIIIDWKNFQ